MAVPSVVQSIFYMFLRHVCPDERCTCRVIASGSIAPGFAEWGSLAAHSGRRALALPLPVLPAASGMIMALFQYDVIKDRSIQVFHRECSNHDAKHQGFSYWGSPLRLSFFRFGGKTCPMCKNGRMHRKQHRRTYHIANSHPSNSCEKLTISAPRSFCGICSKKA